MKVDRFITSIAVPHCPRVLLDSIPSKSGSAGGYRYGCIGNMECLCCVEAGSSREILARIGLREIRRLSCAQHVQACFGSRRCALSCVAPHAQNHFVDLSSRVHMPWHMYSWGCPIEWQHGIRSNAKCEALAGEGRAQFLVFVLSLIFRFSSKICLSTAMC